MPQQQKFRNSHFLYITLLLFIAIAGYWQLAFLEYSVTHDMINCWIPWRFYISESLQNHVFPFWNPYQQLGYPIHADLQGPAWYLESLLLGSTVGMSNYVVQLLFVFYAFLAGVGMYFLSLTFHENRNAAFVTGVCYMLGGFFVAHVQHFYAVIGAAWLPFIILNYYKMYTKSSHKHAIYASVFLFFNLTGGNHTFTFILAYLFASVSLYYFISAWKEKKKELIFRFLKLNALFVTLTAAMSAVVFVVFIQVKPYIARLSGMGYAEASVNPLTPSSLFSLLLPFSTVNGREIFNTDPSMCNIYIGIILIPFIFLSLVRKRSAIGNIMLAFGFICLLASFGSYTPVHKILFNFFPFMDLFRFPSYFSLFSILVFLVLGGKQLAATLSSFTISRHVLIKITIALLLVLLILVITALVKSDGPLFFLRDHKDIFEFLAGANFWQNIILQGGIQLLLLAGLLVVLWKYHSANPLRIITVFAVIDMLVATQLNLGYVGFSPTDPKELHDYVETLPDGFPVPGMNKISENTEEIGQKHGLYRNTSVFHKRISPDVFNTFCFKNQVMLLDSLRPLYDSMLKNPLVYLSSDIQPVGALPRGDAEIRSSSIFLSEEDMDGFGTTLPKTGGDAVEIVSYAPDHIVIKANLESTPLLTLLQCYYTGWKVFVDGKEEKILLSNFLTMSVALQKGEHIVEFVYKNNPVVAAGIVSYLSFALVMLYLSFVWIRENKQYLLVGAIWFILLGAAFHYFFGG